MKMIIIWIIIVIFLYWFFKDNNPYKTYMIIGKKGSGKTCDIAKRSLYYQKKGFKVYSNIEIPGNYTFNPKEIDSKTFDLNSVIFIDEVGLLYDARDYRSFSKGINEWYKYSRQYKCIVYLYSQAFTSDVDLKIRNLVDQMFMMQRIGKITLIRPINKVLGVYKSVNGNGDLIDSYSYMPFWTWKINYMPRYYGLFKSFNPPPRDIIEGTYEAYNDISMLYTSYKSWLILQFKTTVKKLVTAFQSKQKK